LCCCLSEANALPEAWEKSFEYYLRQGVRENYQYVWGASDPNKLTYDTKAKAFKKGLDCSGYVFWAGRKAGIPGIRRTTSFDMGHGGSGWLGDTLLGGLRDAKSTDIVFWTLSKDRPFGHVGVLLHNPATGYPGVTHASSSRGVVMDEVQGWVVKQMVRIRRLTIGDKK
jgi:cell wall-associated NlpC family hydrolase